MQKTNPWRRIAITVSAMLAVLLLAASIRFVVSRGVFTSVEDKSPAACRTVAGVSGVAAIAPDAKAAMAFVATPQGGLYAWHDGALVKLSGTPQDFHPVGMSVVHPAAGARLQTVFARQDGRFTVSTFDVLPGRLSEIGRLTTDQLTDPADLVSIDGARFYLVNRHGTHTALGRWLDDAFLLPRAEVLYFDGMKFVHVAERLSLPTGVALSPDGAHLYVGQGWMRSIASFARDDFTGALDNPALFDFPAGPGKITVAPDGSLIVAASPKRGTGAVYRVYVSDGVPQSAVLLWSSKTEPVTAAAETNGHLLIGTEKRLIDCKE